MEFEEWNNLQSALEIEKYLLKHDTVGAIIATRERMTITCAQLLERMGLTGQIQMYGFDRSEDTMQLLHDEKLQALLCQQHHQMGYESVQVAVDLIIGVQLESDTHIIEYLILDPNNMEV